MDARITTDPAGRKQAVDPCLEPCAVERGMRLIGRKWSGSILWHLGDGPVRFNDLARLVGGASKKMVAQRLDELEAAGLVERRVLSRKPLAVSYEATPLGLSVTKILDDLRSWVEDRGI